MALESLNKITLDVSTPLNTPVVRAVQEDIRSRYVEITLVSNGEPLVLPAGVTAVVGLRRANDTYVLYDTDEDNNPAVTFDGNKATVYLRQEAVAMAGSMYTTVTLFNGTNKKLSAFAFVLKVDQTAVPSNVIVESDYINIFQNELDEINTLLNNLSATATTLPAGSDATASYSDGVFSFGIPKGETGGVSEEEFEAGMASKAPVIIDSASGDIVSVPDGAGGMDARSLVVSMEPIQDLHGYANSWPAGGGKNLFNPNILAGLTQIYDINSDGTITAKYSDGTAWTSVPITELKAGTYTIGYTANSGNARLRTSEDDYATETTVTTTHTFTLTNDGGIKIKAGVGASPYPVIIKLQVEAGSTATAWTPYSNECPISGRTGLTAYRTGVNVWDEEWENGTFNTTTGANIDTGSALNQIRSKNHIPVVGGQSYFFKWVNNNISSGLWTMFYDANGNIITGFVPSGAYVDKSGNCCLFRNRVVETPANAAFCKFYCTNDYGSTYLHDISINCPATDMDYHAYTGASYPVSWQTEAGTVYGGYIDIVSGVLTVTHTVYTFTGEEGWSKQTGKEKYYSSSPNGGYLVSNGKAPTGNDHGVPIITSIGDYNLAYNSLEAEDYGICIATDKRIGITSSLYGKMTGVQICYELATYLSYQLDPQTVSMLLGANNIWSTGDTVDLTYPCDTKLYIQRLTQPIEDDMVANANIPIHKFFMIGNSLYYSTSAIASGESIVVGTNCSSVSLADALNQINA